ncbi:DNA mismatch repair protein [Linnemannia zychae]|nr:DNA mismatch repair protein [Linnemannia zychae]
MASIRRLAPSVSDELRASLVVHSLDQCTAELIQNSIDANATMIEIKIDVAGHSLQVSDNGDGITSTDMARIGTRYATSKCSTLQDLNHITTYGFRGEAMAAITEMALVDIVSRPKEQEHVYSTIFKGGDRLFCGPSSKCPRFNHGTTISVRDLFYKFPVRQRYWSDATPSKIETELEKVKRVVETLAMVAPEISFTLIDISRDSKIFSCRQVDSLLRRITTILGLSIASSLSFVKSSREIDQVYQLSGYISTQAHYNRMCQYIFLNQRPVQCENLRKLVVYLFQQSSFATDSVAYSQQTSAQLQDVRRSKERHPIFILILTCPTSEYDLCADPSKVTIQFEDDFVMGEVEYTRQGPQGLLLPQSISQRSKFSRVSLPHSSAPGSKPFSTSISGIWAQDALCKWVNPVFPTAPTQIPALESLRLDSAGIKAQDFNQQEQMQEHRTVNKVLAVIDQHAADERVRVERLMKKMCTCSLPDPRDVRDSRLGFTELGIGSSTIVSHQLDSMDMVPPLPITLSRREWHLAKLSAEWLHRWGIVLKETASQGNTSNPFDDEAEIGLETVMVSQHFPNDMMMEEDTIGSSIERGHKANKRAVSGTSRSGVDSDFRSGFVVSLPRIISDRCVVDSSLTHDLVKDALSSFEEGRYRPRHMNPGDTQGIIVNLFSAE